MNIPDDLVALCYADLNPNSEEANLLLPTDEVVSAVREASQTGQSTPFLDTWMEEQKKVAAEAIELVSMLPPFDGDELPGWMGSTWAIRLGCPWSAGLSDAVREGKAWLASQ